MTDQNNAAHDLGTSSGGRAYIADYFATHLRRHDFAKYINSTLAADFACALAQHLSKLRAEGVHAGEPTAFEAWAKGVGGDFARHNCGPYDRDAMKLAGMAWRAALASAPVAAQEFTPAFPNGALPAARFHELWERAGKTRNADYTMLENLTWQVGQFADLVAREVSAPVAKPSPASEDFAQEVWAAAQSPHGEPMEKSVARVASLLAEFSAPVAGKPFMYGIMGPDGKAHFEEFCVSGDRSELQTEVVDHLNRDNPEDGTYSVVALFRDAAPQASTEPLSRFCPGCGSVGPVEDKYRDCCPDGNQARMIPARLAEQCRDLFRLAIQPLMADAAANDSSAPQPSEAVRILFPAHLRKMWSGGEVQAWLDEHQGITPPKPTAKGSLERYRTWQAGHTLAAQDGAVCSCPTGDGSLRHPCAVHPPGDKDGGDA